MRDEIVVKPMSEIIPDSADTAAYQDSKPAAERPTRGAAVSSLSDAGLGQLAERAISDDQKFFARPPPRQYRVRRASPAEVEQFARHRACHLEPLPQVRRKVRWWI